MDMLKGVQSKEEARDSVAVGRTAKRMRSKERPRR